MPWKYFHGNCHSDPPKPSDLPDLPKAPPWREFLPRDKFDPPAPGEQLPADAQDRAEHDAYWVRLRKLAAADKRAKERGRNFRIANDQLIVDPDKAGEEAIAAGKKVIDAVNAAIHLRRPLLVTGPPGSGKTSLAYAIAYELQLGPVLKWPITASANLVDALYRYDAIARLQDAQLRKTSSLVDATTLAALWGNDTARLSAEQLAFIRDREMVPVEPGLGNYIRLGPVGTAFLPFLLPRVLLIDEIDKSDLTLPNDLLNLFEEGYFEIPELARYQRQRQQPANAEAETGSGDDAAITTVGVRTADEGLYAPITNGVVKCCEFPIVIMTSNGERDFPPAFYRRCLRVDMPAPQQPQLLEPIVKSHLKEDWPAAKQMINDFLAKTSPSSRATDQLLNAVYLIASRSESLSVEEKERLKELLFRPLRGTS